MTTTWHQPHATGLIGRTDHFRRHPPAGLLTSSITAAPKATPLPRTAATATLTEAGYTKVAQTAPKHVAAVRDLFLDDLTPAQLAALRSVGMKLSTRLTANPTHDSDDDHHC